MMARVSGFSTCRSEEHTSELQSQSNLVCRLLLEKNTATSICNCSDSTTHGPAMRNRGRCNPTSKPQRFMRSGDELRARSYRIAGRDSPALECRVDECDKLFFFTAWMPSEFCMLPPPDALRI